MQQELAQQQGDVRFFFPLPLTARDVGALNERFLLGGVLSLAHWKSLAVLIPSPLPQDQYLSSRSTAIETIESTVAELGQIFSQLAHMVAVQGEQVTRIDADTEDIAANVTGAQSCVPFSLIAVFSSSSSKTSRGFSSPN